MRSLDITHFGNGIQLQNGDGNTIAGNWLGLDLAGAAAPNTSGVSVQAASAGNIIGGVHAASRNVISGSTQHGIAMTDAGTTGNVVEGNRIGTNAAGTAALANGGNGIHLVSGADGNTIGGTIAEQRNVISGNTIGVALFTQSNLVEGNFFGTDQAGAAAIPNTSGFGGVELGADGNTVGGTTAGARNVISGNTAAGISVGGHSNFVKGNYIGTDAAGTAAVPNSVGVEITTAATVNRRRRGDDRGSGETIRFNGGSGVRVDGAATTGDEILRNSILSNGGPGIALVAGGNHSQRTGTITSVMTAGGMTTIKVHLGAMTPSTTFRVEFFVSPSCDPSGAGEGGRFLGSKSPTTDATGAANAQLVVTSLVAGEAVTATVTSPTGDTSRFSICATAP